MKSENKAKVAIIGCGRIAGHHSRSIIATPGAELIALCDLKLEKAEEHAQEIPVPIYRDYREMLRRHPEINAVVVATPSGMHFEHACELMEAFRKNIIVEKPTFMKPSQVEQAYDLAEKMGVSIFPVFQNRHNKAVVRVLRGLHNGELGTVRTLAVRVRWCRPQRYYDLAAWRGTFSHDGGALTNQGIHHVDLLRVFGGDIARVNATMRTLGASIEVEDTAVATFQTKNGVVGTLEVTTAARPDDFEASISLVCEKGLAQIGGIAVNELQIYTPDPTACKTESEDFSRNVYGNGHAKMYLEIASFFREATPFSVSRKDCAQTIRLLNAFYRSDEKGAWMDANSGDESPRLGRPNEEISKLYRTEAR